jgi:hypothetical protein
LNQESKEIFDQSFIDHLKNMSSNFSYQYIIWNMYFIKYSTEIMHAEEQKKMKKDQQSQSPVGYQEMY